MAEKLFLKKYSEANEVFLNTIKDIDTDIIISSENFDRLNIEDIEVLNNFLNDFTVEIIFFKRRLDELLISSWQESIKHGATENWERYFFNHVSAPFKSDILNLERIITLYGDIFGLKSIKIIDFDEAKKSKQDICDLIFQHTGYASLNGIGNAKSVNQSMQYTDIEIIRVLNILYIQKYNKIPYHFIRESYLKMNNMKSKSTTNLIDSVKNHIQESLLTVQFSDMFIFSLLHKTFTKNYGNLIINANISNPYLDAKVYKLPTDTWLVDSAVSKSIEKIYQKAEQYISSDNLYPKRTP